jgi:hypothetical protein
VTGDQLITPQVKIWSIVVLTVYCLIVLSSVVHLYRLFNHLAAGEIYTKTNVRHIRWVGLLAMAMATWQLVLPPLTFALIEVGFLDRNLITVADGAASGGGALLFGVGGGQFSGFVMAALVLLASWIMDVGRETSEEAVGMRHDADLVI